LTVARWRFDRLQGLADVGWLKPRGCRTESTLGMLVACQKPTLMTGSPSGTRSSGRSCSIPRWSDPTVDFLAQLAGAGPALELGIGTGLTTQEEQIQTFHNVAAQLQPGGCFIIENYIPEPRRDHCFRSDDHAR
jgi:hypothetical protein